MSLSNSESLLLSIPTTPVSSHSPNNMIHVLEYSPKEGERGVPITVRLHFNHNNSSDAVFLRLVVGSTPMPTKVRELPDVAYGRWQLDATAPASSSDKVLLSVEALDKNSQVVDKVTFGEFTYWIPNSKFPQTAPSQVRHRRQSSVDSKLNPYNLASSSAFVGRRRANTTSATAIPIVKSESPKPRGHRKEGSRRVRVNSLMRAKYPVCKDVDEELYAQTPLLQLVTSLESMCAAWEPTEMRVGRRLVRFTKVQDGRKLIVSCEAISQDDYRENDSVISCIYREETQSYYVTSVDIIYLLERLTNDEFPVEEKNRIRRNLEGLRPTTVSKHKQGFEFFFQRIMEFPDPKPRNIEKDLKVFEWSLLGQALDKILSKYHVYTSSPTDSTISLPMEPSDDVPSLRNIDHQLVRNNAKSDGYPELVHPSPTSTMKFEPGLYDDRSLLFLQPHHDSMESLPHPAMPLVYHGIAVDPRSTPDHSSTLTGHWTPPDRMATAELATGEYRHLSDFHLPGSHSNEDGSDYGAYLGSYLFPGMTETLTYY
ncbi:hypothetical protein GGU11DRAFT_394735 [Lentinula aff. detonsa]|nr:hypothetical protein GGU11DRAFT_394735 [Lentinula aff. detonsa]